MATFAQRISGVPLSGASGGGGGALADADRYPALSEYLTLERWEDGSARELATLSVFVQDGVLKGCLTDKANRRMAFLTAQGLTDLIGGFEAGLQQDRLDWRP